MIGHAFDAENAKNNWLIRSNRTRAIISINHIYLNANWIMPSTPAITQPRDANRVRARALELTNSANCHSTPPTRFVRPTDRARLFAFPFD